jgi:hypothetical protein
VLTVIYAPPGTQGGGSTSSVSYAQGSTAGSSTSVSSSFRETYAVTASARAFVVDLSGSYSYSKSQVRNDALEVRKSATTTITARGPAVDGIHHDRDEIWLWLNPVIELTLTPSSASWTFGTGIMDVQYVYVGWLRNPSSMPPGVVQRLEAYGITPADYPDILSANPFAYGSTSIDPSRFTRLNTTFPYEPPYAPGDPVPTFSFNTTYSSTDTSASTTAREHTVRATASGGFNFLGLFRAQVRNENAWTWTHTRAHSSSSGINESASVSVGGPSYGYTGPTDLAVYYDQLYKTFMFAPVEGTYLAVRGTVVSRSSQNVVGKEVLMTVDGVTHRTFTNARGEYRFPGKVSGPVELKVGDARRSLSVWAGAEVDFTLP